MKQQLFKSVLAAALFIACGFGHFASAQTPRVTYVAPSGAGSSNGSSPANAMPFATFLTFVSTAANFSTGHVDTFYFAPGTYTISSSNGINIVNSNNAIGKFVFIKDPNVSGEVSFEGSSSRRFYTATDADGSAQNPNSVTFKNLTIKNFNSGSNANGLFHTYYNDNNNTFNLENLIIDNCNPNPSSSVETGAIIYGSAGTVFNIMHCTIRNCGFSYLLYPYPSNTNVINFAYNSVYNNTARNHLMNFYYTASAYNIYNNTFSNNTLTGSSNDKTIRFDSGNSILFANNTMYNSGGLYFGSNSANYNLFNNIVKNDNINAIVSGSYDNVNMRSNIFSTTANSYTFWNTNSQSYVIPQSEFEGVFNTALGNTTEPIIPGRQVHLLDKTKFDVAYSGWNIHSGYSSSLSYTDDQLGTKRPKPFSIGAHDDEYMSLRAQMPSVYYIYTSPVSAQLPDKEIDLSNAIENKITGVPISYTSTAGVANTVLVDSKGTLTLNGSNIAYFTPAANPALLTGTVTFQFKVTQGAYSSIATLEIRFFDAANYGVLKNDLPGYIDPTGTSCFDFMGAVNFTSAYRWQTHIVNSNTQRVAWSVNTLVADLNRDGYPEVIAISIGDNSNTNDYGGWRGISIYNGQTGVRIANFPFKNYLTNGNDMMFRHAGFHSATPFSLIDSDRDGTVELIIAFPNGTDGTNDAAYRNRLVSYNLNYNTTTKTYSMTEKWSTNPQYNSGNTDLHKAVPQICDFDGNGVPEVLVYNKVYNAIDGTFIFETGNITTGTGVAYMGLNKNATNNSDNRIPLSCIYDITGPSGGGPDGIYDIIAGGKIYPVQKSGTTISLGTTITAPNDPGDGYTAVADVDGDGIADIVVVNAASSNMNIVVTVWNPTKGIIAKRTVNVLNHGDGTNSYVFVGDIDGRVQTVGGIDYRLPEIAVLTGNINLNRPNSSTNYFPLHPNISGISEGEGGFPYRNDYSYTNGDGANYRGCLFALTIDKTATNSDDALKGSFILEHADGSSNTGFTMFDFDNDGVNEICYRDNYTLRIIKPTIPYVKREYTNEPTAGANYRPDVILFRQDCGSTTGFEYPVIADIDNDNSAEMIVPGYTNSGNYFTSYIYAVGNGSGDKFAPAWPVWNQYMYDPFKIKIDGDSLVTRLGPAPNRLDIEYNLIREIKDEAGNILSVRDDYNPFNGNLIQAAYIQGTLLPKYEPIVFLTDAGIIQNDDPNVNNRPQIKRIGSSDYIEMVIGNRKTAKSSVKASRPIAVYSDASIAHNKRHTLTLAQLYNDAATPALLGSTFLLSPGDTVRVRIRITPEMGTADGVYIVRFGDSSEGTTWHFGYNNAGDENADHAYKGEFQHGLGIASRQYRDCDWNDQVVRVAKPRTFPDFYTVQEYDTAGIKMAILSNDILPDIPDLPTGSNKPAFLSSLVLNEDSITLMPRAGVLQFNGAAGVANRVTYIHTGKSELQFGIDSFQYRLRYYNPSNNQIKEDIETVYIYVMEGATAGFTVCNNVKNEISLTEKPKGITFEWQNFKKMVLDTALVHNQAAIQQADSVYYIKPILTNVAGETNSAWFRTFEFPQGTLHVKRIPLVAGSYPVMYWTGQVSNKWSDPKNWQTDKGDVVYYAPAPCTDVVIPSPPYPEHFPDLDRPSTIKNITLKDRALLKNPHALTYNQASVEIKIRPTEEVDRFLMWSAPLQEMVAGDYHVSSVAGSPVWGDTYMSLFQAANPDGGTARPTEITQTFKNPGYKLPLGTPFNFKVLQTSVTKDSTLRFPRTNTTYTPSGGSTISLNRDANKVGKFIANAMTKIADEYELPVLGGNSNNEIIQVVNPYMAYLNFAAFLSANDSKIQGAGYYIWNGEDKTGISTIYVPVNGNRYIVNAGHVDNNLNTLLGFIPPLQSFFVKKMSAATDASTLRINPGMTVLSQSSEKGYTLRASKVDAPTSDMKIQLSQLSGSLKEAYAAIICTDSAYKTFDKDYDMQAITIDGLVPVSVYTFGESTPPLAINALNKHHMVDGEIKLGLRVQENGTYKLIFSNLKTFGFNVTLVDKEKNKEINLNTQLSYDFAVTNGAKVIDNRFTLKITGSGPTGIAPTPAAPSLRLLGQNGVIDVRASGKISSLQIYDTLGKLVYSKADVNDSQISIPVAASQLYLVMATVDGTAITEKVLVKN
jgi:hypothetical protein